jgi:hypothetical protein
MRIQVLKGEAGTVEHNVDYVKTSDPPITLPYFTWTQLVLI